MRGWHSRLLPLALAAAAGIGWLFAVPPRGWWPLFPLGVAALTIALYGAGVRTRILVGLTCGLIYHGFGMVWLTDFNAAGYVALVLLQTFLLTAATAAAPSARTGRWAGGWWTLPAALVLLQAVQASFPFGGFPLPAPVYSQVDGPFMAAAPLGGSLLITATAATSGVAVAALIIMRGRRRAWSVAAVAAVVAVVPTAGGLLIETEQVGTVDAAVVQGGGPRGIRAVHMDSMIVTERHFSVAEEIDGPVELVVLPENVADTDGPIAGTELDRRYGALAQSVNAYLVVGVTEGDGDRFRNAAVMWGPGGEITGRYEKEHRVPFGEYIPARGLFERLSDDTAFVPRDAVVGEGEALLDADGLPLGVGISYEVFFSDRIAEAVHAGGQVVLVPTNASSYVTEEVPSLELAAARLRAREFGRDVLMAAPTGYSAIVHADGDVVALSELGDEAILRDDVPLRVGLTPYARLGDVPLVLLAAAVLLVPPAWPVVRRRRRTAG
ncbi:apolipoprotein N-acyltransferase [Phytoactinopolyspora halotolerans]|uniref:Apolipoprotein N-acyltransferase n=1 Tax=Phytoactinopolyspora halotolerans TaxID=1981512 RepID=A0A6L9SES1_9ACTN|nr:apolipoprotein N-acyltransferase [Phytoactinopolyspora halotolerans]NEE03613.1 apolipoprotein N-acyltransferase [Phytoactinopolyspora halotolerans]